MSESQLVAVGCSNVNFGLKIESEDPRDMYIREIWHCAFIRSVVLCIVFCIVNSASGAEHSFCNSGHGSNKDLFIHNVVVILCC